MTKRLYIIPCVLIISLGLALICFGGGWQLGGAGCRTGSCRPGGTSRFASPAPQVTLDTHGPYSPQDSPAAGRAPRPAPPGVGGTPLQDAPWLPLALRGQAHRLWRTKPSFKKIQPAWANQAWLGRRF